MKTLIGIVTSLVLSASVSNAAASPPANKPPVATPPATLALREVRYEGQLSDDAARFVVEINAEAAGKGESSLKLFEGDVAVLPVKLPSELQIVRDGNRYFLNATRAGQYKFKLELVAKIQRVEPWNQISFAGPPAAIASVAAQASGTGMEVQLLSGTLLESAQTNGVSWVLGFLGADQTVALRWQGKVAEVARKAVITVDTTASAQITPTVIKYTTQYHYDIVQGNAARLTLALPAAQALTRLVGEQVRDWQIKADGDRQLLTVEFIKPIEKEYNLALYSEQPVESLSQSRTAAQLDPPQPLDIERESGTFTISTEDTLVEVDSLAGLRQVNASGGALAAYRFNGRPFTLALKLKRIEPVINVADRVTARLEETRLLVSHNLTLNVEKAGIYALELSPPAGFVVADVRGDGIEDWNVAGGKILRVNFSARLLGARTLEVQLEQALKTFPGEIILTPLRVTGAAKQTAQIGAASAPGIWLKTAELSDVREIPVNKLPNRSDELLAFTTEQPDWKLSLASERLAARIVADVFNLVTIGDGVVGGSATIRYGLINQGVQEFKVRVPVYCKNVEFTGPNIRRKEQTGGTNDVIWTIGLQDKVWGGYTLVVTYDYQFTPDTNGVHVGGATLPIGGVHTIGVEHETGSIAITTAASLKLNPKPSGHSLRRVDESELAAADRSLITRSVLLTYQYADADYGLAVDVQRYNQAQVLEAVADRTEITSVLTEAGQMLTQASFMVKNNEKQFQRFQLPGDARLWGCYVNGQPAKPERDGNWVLVSLPRDVNRDQAFAVDIVYSETNRAVKSSWSQPLQLVAPKTDVPNTYAEWQLYVPPSQRLSDFGGSMSVAQGTTYGALDAWKKFLVFYGEVLREAGPGLFLLGVLAFLVIALVISAVRRGWNGIVTVLVVFAVLAVLASMMLPALSKAKSRAQRVNAVNNLKQIGYAARIFAGDNGERLPVSFEEMKAELNNDRITIDPESGQRFVYVGGGYSLDKLQPDSVLAYSPVDTGYRNVLFVDGSVQQVSSAQFAEMSQRGFLHPATPNEMALRDQAVAVQGGQNRVGFYSIGQPAASAANAAPGATRPTMILSGGFGGGIGGALDSGTSVAAQPPPMAAGIRSIRIEIPRSGNSFLFTKVLNVRREPLSIRAKMMPLGTFQTMQMTAQVLIFLAGLGVWWWQWRRERRSSFILSLALSLIIVSVCSLLIAWRALHDLLIVGFPCVALAAIALLIWKYWPRRKTGESQPPLTPPANEIPPVAAVIALLLSLGIANSYAADSAIGNPQPAISNVSILAASYTGVVNDRVAQLDATLRLSSAKPGQTILLFGEEVAVQQFAVKSGEAKLVRDGKNIAVQLGRRGDVTLQLQLLVKLGGDVTKRHLAFGIPPALSSQLALTLDQPDADVDFPTAVSFNRTTDKDKTRVAAVIGAGDRVELLWTPRVKRATEIAATVFCESSSLVTFSGGVVVTRANLDYQVTQGELRQMRVRLPDGQRLLRVEAGSMRTWEITNENGGQVLVVELLKGVSPVYRLAIETEKTIETLPAMVRIETPHALDVKRETGLVALRGADELSLSVESAKELQRVDAEEFARLFGQGSDGIASAFRFLKPDFDLQARAETVQPQIEAVVRSNVRLSTDQAGLSSVIDYTIKRAGVFTLKVALPAGFRVEQVTGNPAPPTQWIERGEGAARVLEITLNERTIGPYSLRLELVKDFKELPKSLAIEGVHPLGAAKLTGFVSVAAEPGVAAKTEAFDGLTEIPSVSLPDYATLSGAGGVLAYKFISPEPKPTPEWKLSVATESVAPWLRAEIVNTLTLTDALVTGRAQVRYDIANAPVKELRLKIPPMFKNVEISGPNIRRRDQTNDEWSVELQSKTRGFYTLTVTWEQPRTADTNLIDLSGVSAADVERETGLLAIVARAPLQVTEQRAAELTRVGARDFPEWAGRPDNATVLAYRYARPGYALAVEAKRFGEAEVLQALADSVRLTTVVADDGQMMTEMSLELRNNGRQFLEVELPDGATVWSAFVAGQPVRPSERGGKLLLPLEQSGANDAPVTVELTYIGANSFPQTRGAVRFVSPKLDVPLKNARWELFLPPDYNYDSFSGTMTRELAAVKPSLFSFTLSEYTGMEKTSKEAVTARARQDVSEARRKLSGGNVREAVADYNRAKANFPAGRDGDDVKKLEKDLNNAQASNLILAQSAFNARNGIQIIEQEQIAGGVQKPVTLYDNNAAEQQWTKLQQAQEIAAAKVQPLHVNLPARGLRYAFTQVLQTEIDRPMTVRLFAANARMVHWPRRIAGVVGGFFVLWAIVALTVRRRRSPAAA